MLSCGVPLHGIYIKRILLFAHDHPQKNKTKQKSNQANECLPSISVSTGTADVPEGCFYGGGGSGGGIDEETGDEIKTV